MTAGSGSEAGNADATISASYFIELPSSVAKSPDTVLQKSHTIKSDSKTATEIYEAVREFIGLANTLVHNEDLGVVSIVDKWHNSLNWTAIKKRGMVHSANNGYTFTASYNPDHQYPYRLRVQKADTIGNPTAFLVDFNGDKRQPSGRIFAYLDLLDSSITSGTKYSVRFSIDNSERLLDITVTSDAITDTSEEIKKLRLYLKEKNNLIHMSACAYIPYIDSLLPDTTEYCYVLVGITDSTANKGVVQLGIPPATYAQNDTTLFTTYGLSQVYRRAILTNRIPSLSDTLKSLIVTSYTDSMTIQQIVQNIIEDGNADFLYPPEAITTMTVEQLHYVLELNQNVVDSVKQAEFKELLWILKLEQPVYFNSNGYAGNGSIPPNEFTYLTEVPLIVAPIAPSTVRALEIHE